jgi:hypothetical protein
VVLVLVLVLVLVGWLGVGGGGVGGTTNKVKSLEASQGAVSYLHSICDGVSERGTYAALLARKQYMPQVSILLLGSMDIAKHLMGARPGYCCMKDTDQLSLWAGAQPLPRKDLLCAQLHLAEDVSICAGFIVQGLVGIHQLRANDALDLKASTSHL